MRNKIQRLICEEKERCPADQLLEVMGPAQEQQLADLFRALGHPARVMILRVLLSRDVCVAGELADLVPLAASTVSQHLKILKESGLIKGEVDGPRRCYCVDKSVFAHFQGMVAELAK